MIFWKLIDQKNGKTKGIKINQPQINLFNAKEFVNKTKKADQRIQIRVPLKSIPQKFNGIPLKTLFGLSKQKWKKLKSFLVERKIIFYIKKKLQQIKKGEFSSNLYLNFTILLADYFRLLSSICFSCFIEVLLLEADINKLDPVA
ncbi:hypothetical protein BpHYR1_036827 [Brachionus plicatilis]|uniref:Uncharacterized protein n=1 Tax=Brachionus plicatilis TaxID=10195 RepID=A0A3M7RGU7_BRAPC|nr:hypothetical protein BpHYR1_036827 [Brachionus plicatilis]